MQLITNEIAMRKFLCAGVFVMLVLMLCSCAGETRRRGEVSVAIAPEVCAGYADYDSVVHVRLTTPDDVVVNVIKSVKTTDSLIVLSDVGGNVYGFERDGTYRCQYGRRGEAGDEYVNMSGFALMPSGGIVICDSYSQKMLFYDAYGSHERNVRFGNSSLSMIQQCESVNDSILVVGRYIYNGQDSVYATVNICNQCVTPFASVPMHTDNVAIPVGDHSVSVYKGRISYIKPLDPLVYRFPDVAWLDLDTGDDVWSEARLGEITDFNPLTYMDAMNHGIFLGYTDIYEMDDYIYLGMSDLEYAIIRKSDWEMKRYGYEKDDEFNFVGMCRIVGAEDDNTIIGFSVDSETEQEELHFYHLRD